MARPPRIEFSGALYYVTSCGNGRKDVFMDDEDREGFLRVLSDVCARFHWSCYAYCLLGKEYSLLIETHRGNLSQGMRQLNGVYTQRFNQKNRRKGQIFQGRFKAIVIDPSERKNNNLLEVARHIVLEPVLAGVARAPKGWAWSSYTNTCRPATAPAWLGVDHLLAAFSPRAALAVKQYQKFVEQGKDQPSPLERVQQQIYLGDARFIEKAKKKAGTGAATKQQTGKSLAYYKKKYKTRNQAIIEAHRSGEYNMQAIADYFTLHHSSVSKIITTAEQAA